LRAIGCKLYKNIMDNTQFFSSPEVTTTEFTPSAEVTTTEVTPSAEVTTTEVTPSVEVTTTEVTPSEVVISQEITTEATTESPEFTIEVSPSPETKPVVQQWVHLFRNPVASDSAPQVPQTTTLNNDNDEAAPRGRQRDRVQRDRVQRDRVQRDQKKHAPRKNVTTQPPKVKDPDFAAKYEKAFTQCLAELYLPKDILDEKVNELQYTINPRTGQPNNSFVIPVDRVLWYSSGKYRMKVRKDEKNFPDPIQDSVMIEDKSFSRNRLYNNYNFQTKLSEYYKVFNVQSTLQFRKQGHKWVLKIGFI